MNAASALSAQARLRPERPAIVDRVRGKDRVTSFADLERSCARAAAMLQASGLKAGDVVLVFQPMSTELYVALVAILRLGLVAMFVDPAAGVAHLEDCCKIKRPQAFIGSAKAQLLRLLSPSLRLIPRKFTTGWPIPGARSWRRLEKFAPLEALAELRPSDPALLTFTSGTLGRPKAVVRSHGFLQAQLRVLSEHLELKAGDVDLTALPIFVLAHLASGVTSVLPDADLRRPDSINPEPVLRQIELYRPNRCVASPAFVARLLEGKHAPWLSSLQRVYTGGGPVFPRLASDLARVAPRARLVAVYGSTEAEPIARVDPEDVDDADRESMRSGGGLLAGRPVNALEVRILPDRWGTPLAPMSRAAFDSLCLPAEQAGEIVVSGEHVLKGYLDVRDDSESKFRVDGRIWHRTGDAGRVDDKGRLWLLGRCASKVRDARGTLYPLPVESACMSLPFVRRAALETLDGRRVLAVELRGLRRLNAEDAAALERRLAFAHIDSIRPLRSIPLDPRHNAKVDHRALRRRLSLSRGI
ncbi:MAG: AMP-binding protein [Elusimicrobia bacterium]|nr:AMP-binding protein [Elusimicrobiota bacterium]